MKNWGELGCLKSTGYALATSSNHKPLSLPRKTKHDFLNVVFNTDDGFAHDVPHTIRHFVG